MPRVRSPLRRLLTDFSVLCLGGIAATHLLDAPGKLDHAPVWAVAFFSLSLAAIVLGVLLNRLWWQPQLWVAAAVLAALPMVGFALSRAVPLPGLEDHVGQWLEPLGIVALVFEVCLLALSTYMLHPVMRLSPATNLASVGVVSFVALAAATGYPVAVGCDQKVMLTSQAGGHHSDPAAYKTQCIGEATRTERAEATTLWRDAWRAARERFPTYAAARAAGYDFAIKPFDEQIAGGSGLLHLTSRTAMRDRRVLDPARPESLVYQVLPDGKVSLAALLFRGSRSKAPPSRGGPIVKWHGHASAGRPGRTVMTHVWLTPSVRTAFAHEAPEQALADARLSAARVGSADGDEGGVPEAGLGARVR
jgi:hypothetical protein